MPKVDVVNKENKSVGQAELPDDIFSVEINKGLLHEVVCNHLANKRQGNACTKTKGDISGGGRKPYKQKGTGRARAGSNRSPLWRGGGTTFGPLPRSYAYRMPKKSKWVALSSALAAKFADGEVMVIDDLTIAGPKTKAVKGLIEGLGLTGTVLVILPEKNEMFELAARNLPKVRVARVSELNVYTVLAHEKLLIAREAVNKMKEAYLG
ncbi:MAG: 50S ribosomal protein L4 [Nitrospirota bacterium]|nr:50S ribosomal protein L4 [Nitrospirota bacterium]